MPEAFGSNRVLDEIGAGRFGPVYRAESATGAHIVVNVFDQGLTVEQSTALAEWLDRLCRAPLDHPSIVPVLETGVHRGCAWLAEPWLDATLLDGIMRSGETLDLSDVVLRVTQVAAALDFAAAVGIYHGTLHPHDILVAGNRTFVAGIGVLQALGDAGLEVPMEGAYVSPQRAQGQPLSAEDDIFALAAIAKELIQLTGVDEERFASGFQKALSPDPRQRPATALEFAAALQEEPVAPAPAVSLPPVAEPIADLPGVEVESELRAAADEAFAPMIADLPLREQEFVPEPRLVETPLDAIQASRIEPIPAIAVPEPELFAVSAPADSRSWNWFGMSAALAIGLLTGFASGFVVGQRDTTPTPRSAERPVARAQRSAPEGQPAPNQGTKPEQQTEPTTGRDFTESEVAPQPVTEEPVTPAPEPSPSVSTTQAEPLRPQSRTTPAVPQEQPEQAGAATLDIDSRPRGARVFIDGRLAGTTPLLVSQVQPGAHAVRIDLIGHRRWVTTVEVAPGARQRVAASLER